MKKLLSMLMVAMLVLSMTTTAFAMESETVATSGWRHTRFTQVQEKIAARQAEIKQNRQEIKDYKAAVQEKRALVKAAAEENKALYQMFTATRKELAEIYSNMEANGITLDTSTLEQITNYRQQVRAKIDELQASKGSIQNYIEANKESLKSLDYEVLESMYANIAEIQSWRNEQLKEINRILGEILALVK